MKLPILTMVLLVASVSNAQRLPEKRIDKSRITMKDFTQGQTPMSPEKLWQLGRVSAEGITHDGQQLIFGVSNYSPEENKSEKNLYVVPIKGGDAVQFTSEKGGESVLQVLDNGDVLYMYGGQIWSKNINGGDAKKLTDYEGGLQNVKLSPDGKSILFSKPVLLRNFHSTDRYKDLSKSNIYIYDDLDYRHWDTFNDGRFSHPFVASFENGKIGEETDIMKDEPYYSPQMPFGGAEDFVWSADSKAILYVSKKKYGKAYAVSTNTDIYRYIIATGETNNITEGMTGYDTHPVYSPGGKYLTWLSMEEDGFESDKNDIVILDEITGQKLNLTAHWDETVNSFLWSNDGKKIYFTAPVRGTLQIFEVRVPASLSSRSLAKIQQISDGQFDITGILAETKDGLIVTSTSMKRAAEVYLFNQKSKNLLAITKVNDFIYEGIKDVKVEGRYTRASDGADLFSWVIYPPDFDPNKKYPTLLYCQGGPQSAVSQFYSFRWNLQLMASQGYIVIAPNRRGMPGWGVEWNKAISKDWGGQPIRDYLSAIDDISKESFVDKDRLGAVGASYGGYSVFMLAGVHEGRFKTFISHCGLFDMTSWYGTTEELFFANHDLGAYWDKSNKKSYTEFNPIHHVDKWNTPILIFQGGKDYRVPVEQGLEAFQAAQLKGVKSRLIYMPDENHWVVDGHNAQVWQREFFNWLGETL